MDEFLLARGAHVLITSRWSDWGGRCHEIGVDTMPEDEAIAFLQARAGRKDEAGARNLVRALGGLPLALDHAGAFVRSAMLSFEAYAGNLEKFLSKAPRDAPYPASVAATFTLAMENALQECAAAETVLGHLAFFGAVLGRSHQWTLDSATTCADSLTHFGQSDEAALLRGSYEESSAGRAATG